MINVDLSHVVALDEFYSEIIAGQKKAHGDDYHEQHDAIKKYLEKGDTYMELGTHQGATAACALLCNPYKAILIDNNMEKYRKFLAPIAEKYCEDKGITLDVRECSSISKDSEAKADVLLIDSLHHPNHMRQELELHGKNIRKYIIAHDTSIINKRKDESLFVCLQRYAKQNGWSVIERGTNNVGYTVIQRMKG